MMYTPPTLTGRTHCEFRASASKGIPSSGAPLRQMLNVPSALRILIILNKRIHASCALSASELLTNPAVLLLQHARQTPRKAQGRSPRSNLFRRGGSELPNAGFNGYGANWESLVISGHYLNIRAAHAQCVQEIRAFPNSLLHRVP
jgi:hypothetical protein